MKPDLGKDSIGLVVTHSDVIQQGFHGSFALLKCDTCFQAYTVTNASTIIL